MSLDYLSRLLPGENKVLYAILYNDDEHLGRLLFPPPRRFPFSWLWPQQEPVVVTDDFLHDMLYCQSGHADATTIFNPQIYRLLCQRLSATLIQDYKNGSRDSPLFIAVISGRVDVLKFLVNNFPDIFDIHQLYLGLPLLRHSACGTNDLEVRREMCLFLVEKGANPNQVGGDGCSPLHHAVVSDETDAALLLLEDCEADPLVAFVNHQLGECNTLEVAIIRGNVVILSSILRFLDSRLDASSGRCHVSMNHGGALFLLLVNNQQTRATKLEICQILMAHVTRVRVTIRKILIAVATQDSLTTALQHLIKRNDRANCAILFEAGMNPGAAMDHAVETGNKPICEWLVEECNVDPFVHQDAAATGVFPFHAAARKSDVAIFGYFLGLWNTRRVHDQGNDENVLDLVLRDPQVSFQAIELLVTQHPLWAKTRNAQGMYPFQAASQSDAQLDVIFLLLKHSPDALDPAENGQPAKRRRLV